MGANKNPKVVKAVIYFTAGQRHRMPIGPQTLRTDPGGSMPEGGPWDSH